ncbi:MAG: polyprenyl diphosphate synthase [Terriglobia bacterium]|jgi:undecaprenyl diphosphate synthase
MIQSTSYKALQCGLHVAIIMDGNGRWATSRGLARSAGHRAGADAVRRTIDAAPSLGIDTLTLFAFTAGNWERPASEVSALLQLFCDFFRAQKKRWAAQGIRVSIIGRRDRLGADLRAAVEEVEKATASGEVMHLRFAVDYSARDAILRAAWRLRSRAGVSPEDFEQILSEVNHSGGPVPDVDLIIRTGGEQRLSDCLLWESAYAELVFFPRMWPEFEGVDLEAAVREFHTRHRRFGRLPESEAAQALAVASRAHAAHAAMPSA